MKSCVNKEMLVLEHKRAIFRYEHSKTREDRIVFGEQVKQSEKRLQNYLLKVKLNREKRKGR